MEGFFILLLLAVIFLISGSIVTYAVFRKTAGTGAKSKMPNTLLQKWSIFRNA